MEKMSVHVNVQMSKIICTPIKVGVRTFATYANRWTLSFCNIEEFHETYFEFITPMYYKMTLIQISYYLNKLQFKSQFCGQIFTTDWNRNTDWNRKV